MQALIAEYIVNPAFAKLAQKNPKLSSSDSPITQEVSDEFLQRLRRFAGFVTKVQNNHLWEELPYTRALLRILGIEHDVFSVFHRQHFALKANRNISRDDRTCHFLEFLTKWIRGFPEPNRIFLQTTVKYETILFRMRRSKQQATTLYESRFASKPRTKAMAHTLMLNGQLQIGYFRDDPVIVLESIVANRLPPVDRKPSARHYAFWQIEGEPITFRIKPFIASLLKRIDGETTAEELIHSIESTRNTAAKIDAALLALIDRGIVSRVRRSSSSLK